MYNTTKIQKSFDFSKKSLIYTFMSKKKKSRKVKSFNQFFKPFYPLTGAMGISYYDNDQDCYMNDVVGEDEEIFRKGEQCKCKGNEDCEDCNGHGFKLIGDLD